jgi:hypothetical protein
LTAATFFKMRKVFFEDKIEDEFYKYVLFRICMLGFQASGGSFD